MIEQKQLYLHKPETGQIGDCFRTSVACILNLPAVEVPHYVAEFWKGEDESTVDTVLRETNRWLNENHSAGYIEFPVGAVDNEQLFAWASSYIPANLNFVLGCSSKNGGHAVVARSDGYVWDPAIDNSGCVGPMKDGYYWIGMIVKL